MFIRNLKDLYNIIDTLINLDFIKRFFRRII